MIDKTQMGLSITKVVAKALRNPPETTPQALCRKLHGSTTQLRRYYTQANNKKNRSPVDEWLCDNYYVLEKESKQTVKDIRHLARNNGGGETMEIFAAFHAVLTELRPPISDDTLSRVLEAVGRRHFVSEKQFSFVPAAVKSVLILLAYNACIHSQSEEEISYAITGLGKLTSVDLEEVIGGCSTTEKILMQDPADIYARMDNESRRFYRAQIARIAYKTREPEQAIAQKMLESCAAQKGIRRHIGYPILNHHSLCSQRRRRGKTAVALMVLLPMAVSGLLALLVGSPMLLVLCYLPLWEILRTPIQQYALSGVEVDFIPRMDLKEMEDKPKTAVLVSTLLPKAADAPALRGRLEQLYFSNSDPDMYYCILADFKEWSYPYDDKDDSQVAAARKVVEELNRRYNNRFMLFLRGRVYNKTQNKYSGWERKRGAITEFIRFLKGEKTSLHTFVGDWGVLGKIKYIIALDADTRLLYESAQTLVSAAAHPLNQPVWNEDGVVVGGYGILTPKISTDLHSAKGTAFSRVMSGCGGVTAYETKDKDFYQDLFFQSIFAGKGLIHVDSFHQLLSDRFPDNQVLSHDILEGAYLRVGFVSDVEMTDGAPQNMMSWLSRLHRWLRGDWQNIKFLGRQYKVQGKTYRNPISNLSKYQVFDNLRRSLTPVAGLLCLVAALISPTPQAMLLAAVGILSVTFSSLWAAVWSLFTGGVFALSRKFFTRTLPHSLELLGQAAILLIFLPAQAFFTLDAAARSLWRTYVSHKRMLEWTTAAQSDTRRVTVGTVIKRLWPTELFALAYILLSTHPALILIGIAFALCMPAAYYTARPTREDKHALSGADRDTLISYNAAMWRYYEEFAGAENHYLPPDNIQQSPVYRVAQRTSPTNIGMMMLSTLAARDLDFIDTAGLYLRIQRTLSSVEKLETWNGNLYNWYDTATLDTLKPEFVSTVDSGNFICCLVALGEGLREFVPEKAEFKDLIRRIEAIIENCDLSCFYNKRQKLFSIGWDAQTGKLNQSHYDFLMSEARLTSYYAVARKTVGKKHWGTLSRTMSRNGSYAGAVSWTGTMFEYFMPHLLLPVYDGSLMSEALIYCLFCQKKRIKGLGIPWGISESAFYAFDNNLNYQYKAHGVQKIGVKRYLDRELVISPYSTFITIPLNPNSSMRNLRELHDLGVYGRYGFYEAVDFTASRVGKGALAVTRSYMAHHIGMSMVSSCNALFENRMQKRFMRDHYMQSANEFLEEKIAKSTVIYDELKNTDGRGEKHERPKMREQSRSIYPQEPRCSLLTNGEITDVLTDSGAGYLKFGGVDVTRRSTDLLRRSQGVVAVARTEACTLPVTKAPFYDPGVEYTVETQEQSVTYYAKKRELEVGMRCVIHPTISCEQRQIVVKNTSGTRQLCRLLVYFEPVLCDNQDYSAHPAYSKLFVTAGYDENLKTLTFSRRGRDSTQEMFLTVGFLQDVDFQYELCREKLMSAPEGMEDLLAFHKKQFSSSGNGVPDACCALKFDLLVPPGGQQQVTLLLAPSRTASEGQSSIISMRGLGVLETKNAAKSPVLGDSLEGRLGGRILGQLLFQSPETEESIKNKRENTLGQSGLWPLGISGDLPIALLELDYGYDLEILESYLRLHTSLRNLKVEYDLCLMARDAGLFQDVMDCVEKHCGPGILGCRGGVFVLDRENLTTDALTLLRAVARHWNRGELPENAQTPREYLPVEIRTVSPAPLPEKPELTVGGGVFADGKFYVDKTSPLPYTHILSNSGFGTLVSDRALGYTWAVNSRENKLTPWYNDICTDNDGELLLVRDGEGYYDLIAGSRACFQRGEAVYQGRVSRLESRVTVWVRGNAKIVEVVLKNRTDRELSVECAYYTEPVLGVTRDTARYVSPETYGDALVLHNSYNTAIRCYAALRAEGERSSFLTDRAAFLCGDWGERAPQPGGDPCAAVIVPLKLPSKRDVRIRYILSYGATAGEAVRNAVPEDNGPGLDPLSPMDPDRPGENRFFIKTPDPHLDQYINYFAPHQILHSRIWGRTAFYQCGGAFGFRDQLQDVGAYLLLDAGVAREQILRCCSVQFREGDVLHWWHDLPADAGGLKGVRTKFSDDLIWLPVTVADYVQKTGDQSVMEERVHYLEAAVLGEREHESYISPAKSDLCEDVYAHCVRALERGYNLGENGLPLIGCGDWCDGYSAVGLRGKGTSVWLALFLSRTLTDFVPLCRLRGDDERASRYLEWAESLKKAVDQHGWDGEWYLRAFYDDGTPMGSHKNRECGIDLLPQTFAVFAGMPDKERVSTALQNAADLLWDRNLCLVRLFTQPFQHSAQKPGYVKAYPAGIRENGGQYTHSAVWFAIALMQGGRLEEGAEVLRMLNPVWRASQDRLSAVYKLEPYYMPADIYTNSGAEGRGGWSLYTGAASWYYRAVLETLLGIQMRGDRLYLNPMLPPGWPEASLEALIRGGRLRIQIRRGNDAGLWCDRAPAQWVPLDGEDHSVEVVL